MDVSSPNQDYLQTVYKEHRAHHLLRGGESLSPSKCATLRHKLDTFLQFVYQEQKAS